MGVYTCTWIGNFDVESVTNEDISGGEIAMNESMLCQKILCIKATSKIKDDYKKCSTSLLQTPLEWLKMCPYFKYV